MSETSPRHAPGLIDARGPRFAAGVTAVLLLLALILGPTASLPVLVVQGIAFLLGAALGVRFQPWGAAFRWLVRPFLGKPTEFEDPGPPRFAQAVGLAFVAAALVAIPLGAPVLFYVATGLAFAAALLNVAFDFCLGCELYLLGARLFGGSLRGTGKAATR